MRLSLFMFRERNWLEQFSHDNDIDDHRPALGLGWGPYVL